jgi:hypothetical protein
MPNMTHAAPSLGNPRSHRAAAGVAGAEKEHPSHWRKIAQLSSEQHYFATQEPSSTPLQRSRSHTVPYPSPSFSAIFRRQGPSPRKRISSSRLTTRRGRPSGEEADLQLTSVGTVLRIYYNDAF